MTRLGIVVGSILAELTQARRIADTLSRELIEEYRNDALLSTMSVPRAVLGDVTINLKFQVTEVEAAPVQVITAAELTTLWTRTFQTVTLPRFLAGLDLTREETEQLVTAITTDLRAPQIRALLAAQAAEAGQGDLPRPLPPLGPRGPVLQPPAIDRLDRWEPRVDPDAVRQVVEKGDTQPLVDSTVKLVGDSWMQVPQAVRTKLGSKERFIGDLTGRVSDELDRTIETETSHNEVVAALKSRIDVLVEGSEVTDPARVQTLAITLRGADLETVVGEEVGG